MERKGSTSDSSACISPCGSPFLSNDNSPLYSPIISRSASLYRSSPGKESPDSLRSNSCTGLSPYTSHFYSPRSSPNNSRGTSPVRSPMSSPCSTPILELKRANSYKQKAKKTTLDVEKIDRQEKMLPRTRSKSTSDISIKCLTFKNSDTVCSSEAIKNCCENSKISSESKKSPSSRRKKSLAALLGLTSIELPKLRRSNSQRSNNRKMDHEAYYNGPLFQATTLFVPGYDFKSKQSTPLLGRKHSTPFFTRRGSAGNVLNQEKEKRNSTPNLSRRGSADTKKIAIRKHKTSNRQTLERSVSSPSHMQSDSSSDEEVFVQNKDYLTLAERPKQNNGQIINCQENTSMDKDIISKSAHKVTRTAVTFQDKVHINRSNIQRLKVHINRSNIQRLGIYGSQEFQHDSVYRDRVEKFENPVYKSRSQSMVELASTLFVNNYESGYESPIDNNNGQKCQHDGGKQNGAYPVYQFITKPSVNNDGNNFMYTASVRLNDYQNSTFPYDSLKQFSTKSDFSDLNKCRKAISIPYDNLKQINSKSDLSGSWSHGQWKSTQQKFYNVLTPDIARVISTDLCVTEL